MVDLRTFVPKASQWTCRWCNEAFWWVPGATKDEGPVECPCGKTKDKALLVKVVIIEGR